MIKYILCEIILPFFDHFLLAPPLWALDPPLLTLSTLNISLFFELVQIAAIRFMPTT